MNKILLILTLLMISYPAAAQSTAQQALLGTTTIIGCHGGNTYTPCFNQFGPSNPMYITTSGGTFFTLTTTGSSGPSVYLNGNLNIPQYSGGSSGSTSLSAITSATATNSIDSTLFAQTWSWSTLTTQTALSLTATALTTGKVLSASTSTVGNTGYAGYFSNTATTGFGVYSNGVIGSSQGGLSLDNLFSATATGANPQIFPRTATGAYTAQNVYVYNADPALVPNLRGCLAGVRNTPIATSCTIMFQGDSTFQSFSNSSSSGDWINGSVPSRLVARLNQLGIPADSNGALFNGGANDQAAHNGQVVQGSSWTSALGGDACGGAQMLATTNTNAFTYTPNVPTDTVQVFYISNSGFGSFTTNVNGAPITTTNSNAAANILSVTTTAALGMNSYGIQRTGGGSTTVTLCGFLATNSTKPSLHVLNGTVDGWAASDFAATFFNFGTVQLMKQILPKVTIEECGIVNDWNGAETVASFKSNCQIAITNALASGDVILSTANPTQTTTTSYATQLGYVQAMYQLATSNNIPLIDTWSAAPTWTSMNAQSEMFDNKHPNGKGYSQLADQYVNAIMHLAGSGGGIGNTAQTPTVASGFGTGAIVTTGSTSAFQLNVGTGGTANSGILTMPPATYGWNCNFHDITTPASFVSDLAATTSTSVTVNNYSRTTGSAIAWTASDVLSGGCAPN